MFFARPPIEPLRPWVRLLWQAERRAVLSPREIALPTGNFSWTICVTGPPFAVDAGRGWQTNASGWWWGAVSQPVLRDTARLGITIGVEFWPGMAASLWSLPASEWAGRVSGFENRDWLERIRNADDRLACVESLLSQLRPSPVDPAIAAAIQRIVAAPAVARVDSLCQLTGYSPRRFEQAFFAQAGLLPKQFIRIHRFGLALQRLAHKPLNLAQIALECGLSDQSHLNREFRQYAGVSPGRFPAVDPARPHHLVLPEFFSKTDPPLPR